MKRTAWAVLAAGLWVVAGCGGGDNKGNQATPCPNGDADCGRGFVCMEGACAKVECQDATACGAGDRICVAIPAPGFDPAKTYCTHLECTPAIPCSEATQDCVDGLCLPKAVPPEGTDAVQTDVPPSEVPEVVGDTGGDQGPPPPPGVDCKPCQGAADCGEGAACAPVAGNKYCLRECEDDGDCKGGYICYQVIQPGPKHCLPVSYKCVACAYEGCGAGKCCDLVTGDCDDCLDECGRCTYDFDCAAGYRCYKKAGSPTGNCVAECGQGGTCPDPSKFSCGDNGKGVQVCIPKDDQVCQTCPPDKPYTLPDGTCVQCLNSTHCLTAGQYCDETTHTCVDQGCGSGTYKCQDGACHQCCEDAHCAGLPPPATGKCVNYQCEGAADPCGNTCADPYPVCANVGGTWQCVQCAADADCKVPNCKCSNNLCVDSTTGQACTPPQQCGAECSSDADCPPGQNGETLACNTQFKTCYKPGGGCDGVTACCAPGQTCVDLLMLLFGGGMGGLPGMPGGTTGMGYCSCNTQADCLGGEPCTPMSMLCAIPFINTLVCPGGSLPPTIPQNMCFDISSLLGPGLGI